MAQSGEKAVDTGNGTPPCYIANLPSELINAILSFLPPADIVFLSATCRHLYRHATSDHLWHRFVQENVPGVRLASPAPFPSFQAMFAAHEPHWFVTRRKIWFSGRDLAGRLIVARYDPRRGCIEGYRLVAINKRTSDPEPWQANPEVHIHPFSPTVSLHLDRPVLVLRPRTAISPSTSPDKAVNPSPPTLVRRRRALVAETPMDLDGQQSTLTAMYNSFVLARPLPAMEAAAIMTRHFPYGNLWPPPTIPTSHFVAGATMPRRDGGPPQLQEEDAAAGLPSSRAEISELAFRTRSRPELRRIAPLGVHLGEETTTYATMVPELYTPTAEFPFRGIWVGDYSAHRCEFLLVRQVDPRQDSWPGEEDRRGRNSTGYRGRLDAVKLTGDPNVPRGECSFMVADLSERGLVKTLEEPPFRGARVFRSRGHIASTGFRNDTYIRTELIVVSHDCLAQHWIEFGHISYYHRVDIDQFLSA